MPDLSLERLLWRYEYGLFPSNRLDYLLREEASQLVTAFEGHRGQLDVLRQWDHGLIYAFDEAVSQAYRQLDGQNRREALRQIKQARIGLETIKQILRAHSDLMSIRSALKQLGRLVSIERLRQFPAINSIEQMVELTEQFMRNRQYRQAIFVARFCARQIETLERREPTTSVRSEKLVARLNQIRAICAGTGHFVSTPELDLQNDGTLGKLQVLVREGWLTLAEQLITDLEVTLASRRLFYDEYQRALTDPALEPWLASIRELNVIKRDQSWDVALRRLRETTLAVCADQLRQSQSRLQRVTEQLKPHLEVTQSAPQAATEQANGP